MNLYTDHRDELINLQRQCIDGNTVTKDGYPIHQKIKELSDLVKDEKETRESNEPGYR